MEKKPLIILTGPTAVGKTELSIALAKKINGEIISADSMQVYKYMDIGTAKIMPEEMDGVSHYLVDELDPSEEFHVVRFQQMAKKAMEEIYSKGKIPIIVGGTGFYIQSVIYDIDFSKTEADKEYRSKLNDIAVREGVEELHKKLQSVDPVSAQKIPPQNVKRVIRALEYYKQTGEPISKHNEEQQQRNSPYNYHYFVLNLPREILYERIEKRIDNMMQVGLLEEVKMLKNRGYTKDLVSMQGIGYKELLEFLDDKCSLLEAVSQIKLHTRHFAKRQLTWFRRERNVNWIEKDKFQTNEEIVDHIIEKCKTMEVSNEYGKIL